MEYNSDSRLMFFKSKEIMEENSTGGTKFAGANDAATSSTTSTSAAAAGGEEAEEAEKGSILRREHMFDKVVTPSDVGKLNRLVIPKQHAEKYFPLDTSSNEKGLLLNFEDSAGKPWRFRYSYWNSSQSYVMTKGWSRFVKEKKLDAGDIVSFERGITMTGEARLYIGWKRRPDAPPADRMLASRLFWPPPPRRPMQTQMPIPPPPHPSYYDYYSYGALSYIEAPPPSSPSVFYLRARGSGGAPHDQPLPVGNSSLIAAAAQAAMPPTATTVFDSVPIIHGKAAAKRVRLFGVNLDFPTPMEEDHDQTATADDEDNEEGEEVEGFSRSSMVLMGGCSSSSTSSSPSFSSSSSTMPNWLSQATAPSHLQLSLDGGASASSSSSSRTVLPPSYQSSELQKKGKPPSLSFDL